MNSHSGLPPLVQTCSAGPSAHGRDLQPRRCAHMPRRCAHMPRRCAPMPRHAHRMWHTRHASQHWLPAWIGSAPAVHACPPPLALNIHRHITHMHTPLPLRASNTPAPPFPSTHLFTCTRVQPRMRESAMRGTTHQGLHICGSQAEGAASAAGGTLLGCRAFGGFTPTCTLFVGLRCFYHKHAHMSKQESKRAQVRSSCMHLKPRKCMCVSAQPWGGTQKWEGASTHRSHTNLCTHPVV